MKKSKGKKSGGKGGQSKSDAGKMPNWDGKKQAPSSKNKGFGSC